MPCGYLCSESAVGSEHSSLGAKTRRCKKRSIAVQINGQVAQSVEQGTENPCVGSSILSLATIQISYIA